MLFALYVRFHILVRLRKLSYYLLGNGRSLGLQNVFLVQVSNCQFSFSHFGFWSGNFFLIAPFPGHCLLVPRSNECFGYVIVSPERLTLKYILLLSF